jgi:nicotinate-nucleotide--dimethylbenzimidazole phosphoribosyltransferase
MEPKFPKGEAILKEDILEKTLDAIKPANADTAGKAKARLDNLTKPRGSLGALEECAWRYLAARGDFDADIAKPTILTFAGDHGVAKRGVSAFPQEVTPQMVANFAAGGAAINVLARRAGAELVVVDVGVAADIPVKTASDPNTTLIIKKVARGTADIAEGPAMSRETALEAMAVGIETAENAVKAGSTLLGVGDMGIANTTPSAAIYCASLGLEPADAVGRGTGIDDDALARKTRVVEKAVEVNAAVVASGDPVEIMAALGGLEIAAICGAILGAAANRIPVAIDGFISGAAAVTALKMNPNVMDYCFFSHLSAEAGHAKAMEKLGVKPLLDFGLRLGEGTGAALAFGVIDAGMRIFREMATFDDAGVSDKD